MFTVDPRLERELGHVLPDKAILPWLRALQTGKQPQLGPDRQVEAERKQFASLAKKIRQAFQGTTPPLPTGDLETKKDGPFHITTRTPERWIRDREGEKSYAPTGPRVDPDGRTIAETPNPYAEIYLTPKRRGPFFIRVRAAKGNGDGKNILKEFERLVAAKGYLPVGIERWNDGTWTYDISLYLLAWEGKWQRWISFSAANNNAPAAPLIMVMDATDTPDPNQMVAALKCMLQSTKIAWIGEKTTPKKLD